MTLTPTDHYFVSFDKTPIHYVRTRCEHEPRANLLIIHGHSEYGRRYSNFADYLACHGVNVYAADLRGFGKSGGKPAHVRDFGDYARDILPLVDKIQTQDRRPFFVLGHSLGGLIASYTAAHFLLKPIHGLILSSPCFGLSGSLNPLKRRFACLAAKLWPTLLCDTGLRPDILTHDQAIIDAYLKDTQLRHQMSTQLYANIEKEISASSKIASRLQCPVLLIQAGDDRVVDPNASQRFFESLVVADKNLKVYPGLFHELLNESSRLDVYEDVLRWVERHL